MLEEYFHTMTATPEQKQRALAVQAALEIIKSSALGGSEVMSLVNTAKDEVGLLADAIQSAISASQQ
ncbi:hypothetical protein F652_1457 [Enterobacteriaceae bacterium bta3-1]|nr:hypothetical protein F652_1457 [Enterobacteriaceae bacterium bta3-1]